MAALDVLQLVPVQGSGTPVTVTFSSVAAGDLLVFVVMCGSGASVVTPPAGLTAYTNVNTEWPRLATYARVVQAGDSASWAFGFSNTDSNVIQGYRIEGPFSDLTGVTITADASFASGTSRKVLLSDATVTANTLVLAAICHYGSSTFSFSNAFTNAQNTTGIGAGVLGTARRLYSTGASDVSTTATWTGSDSGNSALIRIAAPSGGGGTGSPYRQHFGAVCAGSTSVIRYCYLQNTDGTPATGKLHTAVNAAYVREVAAPTAVTLSAGAVAAAWSSGAFSEVDATNCPGLYRVDWPDAAFAVGAADSVTLVVRGTGLRPSEEVVPLAMEPVLYGGEVTTGATPSTIPTTGLPTLTTGQLNRRLLQFTSGPCTGERVLIVGQSSGGVLQVAPKTTVAASDGDTFMIL